MKNLKFSIIVPSYNQGKYIEETLLSIINQKYQNFELIIIDGGSSDNTLEILKKYAKNFTFWVSESDKGQTDALIKGFKIATGDILCWLCSDDLLMENALSDVVDFFNKHPNEHVVSGDAIWIDTDGNILKYNKDIPFIKWIWIYTYNYIIQPSTFWTREIYELTGGLDKTKQLSMDADLWIRFSEQTRINKLSKVLSKLRLYHDQRNIKYRDISDIEDKLIRKRYNINFNSFFTNFFIMPFAKSIRIILKFFYGSYFNTNYFKSFMKFKVK